MLLVNSSPTGYLEYMNMHQQAFLEGAPSKKLMDLSEEHANLSQSDFLLTQPVNSSFQSSAKALIFNDTEGLEQNGSFF